MTYLGTSSVSHGCGHLSESKPKPAAHVLCKSLLRHIDTLITAQMPDNVRSSSTVKAFTARIAGCKLTFGNQFVCQGGVRSIGSGMEVPGLPEQIGVEQIQSIGLRSWAIVNSGLLCWASASKLMSLGWGHRSSLQWRRAFPVLTATIEADLRGHAGQPGPGRLMKAAALRQALAQS